MNRSRRTNANYGRLNEEEEPIVQEAQTRAQTRNRGGRGRGRGRGRGQGRGQDGGEAPTPDLATMIAQTVANIMPTIVAQVTASLQAPNNPVPNAETQGNVNNEEVQPGAEEEEEAPVIHDNYIPRFNQHGVYRQGCSFKDFKSCGAPEFNGSGGPTDCIRWLEEVEAVIARSHCTQDDRVTYSSGMFKGDALSWWNKEKGANNAIPWDQFKVLVRERFCPPYELQTLTLEFIQLQMNGSDYKGYIRCTQ